MLFTNATSSRLKRVPSFARSLGLVFSVENRRGLFRIYEYPRTRKGIFRATVRIRIFNNTIWQNSHGFVLSIWIFFRSDNFFTRCVIIYNLCLYYSMIFVAIVILRTKIMHTMYAIKIIHRLIFIQIFCHIFS